MRMTYSLKTHYAVVRNGHVEYEGEEYSPSGLASHIAGGQARNAWRDFYLRLPLSEEWLPAEEWRKRMLEHPRWFSAIRGIAWSVRKFGVE